MTPSQIQQQPYTMEQLNQFMTYAQEAVLLGRECLLKYFGKIKQIEEKDQAAGLVSEADKESERIISEYLKLKCPDFDFLGEESAYEMNQSQFDISEKPRWILDPLDGTTNFVHRFPVFCISLALEYKGDILLGIIDMPILNQNFYSIKGQGAFCKSLVVTEINEKVSYQFQNEKLQISQTKTLDKAFMSTGFVNEKKEVLQEQLRIFEDVVWKARAIRRPGAAAYDLALIASGVFDLYWEKNLKPWDSAAGLLLVKEAGGVVITFENENYNPFKKSLIAGNQEITSLFQSEISRVTKS